VTGDISCIYCTFEDPVDHSGKGLIEIKNIHNGLLGISRVPRRDVSH
jgi:hypothetical protein